MPRRSLTKERNTPAFRPIARIDGFDTIAGSNTFSDLHSLQVPVLVAFPRPRTWEAQMTGACPRDYVFAINSSQWRKVGAC